MKKIYISRYIFFVFQEICVQLEKKNSEEKLFSKVFQFVKLKKIE